MRITLILIALIFFGTQSFAGKITGSVKDEKTSEGIIGAVVIIKGTDVGTVTDVDGNFELSADPGTYVLQVKYVGYQTKELEDVHISKENTPITIILSESKATQLEEMVVRSSLKKENINALYAIQKNSATISDGISADVIRKSPDRNTGEVLKRVSGTTIQDNKYVVVRGLSDRYNTALVDNAILPSTEPNRKAFSFDIIPSAMVDNIIITKAATPDLPGDFAGGIINILTRETPDQNFNSLSIGSSYNTVSTGKVFRSGYRTKSDFLGFDDGSRQLPSGFPTGRKVAAGLTQEQQTKALGMLNNDFRIKQHTALPGISLQGVLGRTYGLKHGNRFGFTGALTYGHSENIKPDLLRRYDGYDYKDNVYNYSSNLGAMLNAGYYFGGNKIVFKSLYNRIFDDNFLHRTGTNNSSSSEVRYYAFDLIQKSLLKTSIEGDHQVGKGQNKFGWLLSHNRVTNNQPDQRKVSYSRMIGSTGDFFADNTTIGKANNRLFGDLKEDILSGNVYYSMPFNMLQRKNNLKIGGSVQYRNRSVTNRYVGAVMNVYNNNEGDIRVRPIETLFGKDVIENGSYRLEEITSDGDQYDAAATTAAGYAMLDNKLSDKIRMVWGARYESYQLRLNSGSANISPTWNDLLPSVNLTYSLSERSNLRASYFRSVARPELRESANLSYYDYELNAILYGIPSLMRSQINNVDLRYEIYPNPGEILSASVFYKDFNNTIESNVNFQNSSLEIHPENYDGARNLGVEAELRKNLGFISRNSFLQHVTFYANLAYIHSEVKLNSIAYANGHAYKSRPLSGQSPYVINTSLGYAAMDGKLNFNLLYNRIGQRLFLVAGEGRFGHVYESERNLLDFQASYQLSKRSDLRLNVKDLLNNPVRLYFDQDNNGTFDKQPASGSTIDPNKDYIWQEYRPGSVFSLTYTYRF